jgi:hypothetical protein
MSEKSIIFSAPMVRAILEGRKTQTRRVVKRPPLDVAQPDSVVQKGDAFFNSYGNLGAGTGQVLISLKCPFEKGMTLWVRETWNVAPRAVNIPHIGRVENNPLAAIPKERPENCKIYYRAQIDDEKAFLEHKEACLAKWYWRSPILMPRWASRVMLSVTGVRCERLRDMTEEDAIAEGCGSVIEYWETWNRLNTKRGFGWDANPYVWVIEFEVLEARA